ncbi:von Willebrand factor D and EGF domain-containing protein-like [Pecten maximus]|uniref:von Willebrand factor D and EGF domain-containing protein-like n=1 Tax=Pecten maximus TaxID=6579 RepID=UPI001458D4D7|nr:von Willebrand factor D and EGF domain-containing protein-like [Pecten maximus]
MIFLIFALAQGLHLGVADPCTDYKELPFADLRFVNNIYNIADDPVLERQVSCSVRARTTTKGPPGSSMKSAEVFIGIKVQTRFRSCDYDNVHRGGPPFCVWGVAVQAGRDVFVIDRKSGYANYRVCNDSALDVRQKGTTLYRLSNSTEWTDSSREALQSSCLAELELNTTLETKGVTGKPSIAAAIKEIACPGNCSDFGTCDCDDGFGGPDCSIDLSIPPFFEELLDDGMCDKQRWECDSAMATGDDFLAKGHLKCNMTPFWYDINGVVHEEKGTIVTAEIQTFMNLFCPLTMTRRKRDTSGNHVDNNTFIEGYHVALSNDGIHFGDLHTLFIFDSKCQTPMSYRGKQAFVLKEGYCFINNKCTVENDVNPADICQMCNPAASSYKWSKRTTMAECNPMVPEEESDYLWVIGVVAGVIAAVAIIGLVMWKIKVRKVEKVSDSSMFSDTVKGRG